MTILDFEQHIHPKEIRKGLSYYRGGRVQELEKDGGAWEATVQGRDEYEVQIEMDKVFIGDTSCDCAVFNDKDQCKHVVATLFAIRSELGLIPGDEMATTGSGQEVFAHFITGMNEGLLREAIIAYAGKNEGFRIQFMTQHSADKAVTHTVSATGSLKVVRDTPAAATKPVSAKEKSPIDDSKALEKAQRLMKSGKYSEMLDFVFARMDALANSRVLPDETDKAIVKAIDAYFDLLFDFCCVDDEEELNHRLREHTIQQLENPAYDLNDHVVHWVDLAVYVDYDDEGDAELLDRLEKMKMQARRDGDWEAVKHIDSSRQFVMDYHREVSDNEKDDNDNNNLVNEQIEAAKARNDHREVKRLLLEKLERLKRQGKRYLYKAVCDELISLLKTNSSDVLELRKLAKRFYEETGHTTFYEVMRDTYIKSQWEPLGKAYLARLESDMPLYIKGEADAVPLAELYVIEESDEDKLLALLQQVRNLRLLNEYAYWLDSAYCLDLCDLYIRLITEYASLGSNPAANRLIYSSLKELCDLNGGRKAAKKVLAALYDWYPDKNILPVMEAGLKV